MGFNYLRAAQALSMADFEELEDVAVRFGVTVRAIQYWRKRLEHDEELQQEYRKASDAKIAEIAKVVPVQILNVAERIPRSIDRILDFLNTCFDELDPGDPESARVAKECGGMLVELFMVSKKLGNL